MIVRLHTTTIDIIGARAELSKWQGFLKIAFLDLSYGCSRD